MRIKIDGSKTIKMMQREFRNRFPYLKIEVFSRAHSAGEGSRKKFMQEEGKTLDECRAIRNNGIIVVLPSMTVAELENKFLDEYGLSVQIFRQSGKVWLETIHTDHWTLAQQNELGEYSVRELSAIYRNEV